MVVEYTSAAAYDFIPQPAIAAVGAKSTGGLAQTEAISGDQNKDGDGEFRLFGKDGLTFSDILDIVNPLQHLPIVSTLYRAITGDQIDPAARVAGGTLYGGPIGAAVSVLNVVVEHGTGKDVGDHVASLFTTEDLPDNVAAVTPSQNSGLPQQTRAAVGGQNGASSVQQLAAVADNTAGMSAIPIANPAPQFAAQPGGTNVAGMSAIPVVREDVIAKFFQGQTRLADGAAPATLPDLGALNDPAPVANPVPGSSTIAGIVRANREALKTEITAASAGGATTPKQAAIRPAEFETAAEPAVASPAAVAANARATSRGAAGTAAPPGNNWVVDAMLRALDKYEGAAKLRNGTSNPATSVIR